MKKIVTAAALFVLFLYGGKLTVNGQTSGTGTGGKLETEVGKVLRDYYDAFSRRDTVMASAIFADDGFSYSRESGYETNLKVKEEVNAYLRSPMAAASKETYEIENLKVVSIATDFAMANYLLISKTQQSGKTDIRRDRSTNVLVRRDGRWQIVMDHTSREPNPAGSAGLPIGWKRNNGENYAITVDTNIRHGGKASATIRFTCGDGAGFGSISQILAADDFRGKRVRLSGWLRTENADTAGLWMRIDGNRRLLGFDNMANRAVTGTTEWKRYEVVLDVPAEAVNLLIGTLIEGKGQVWLDDLKLETVGSDVPPTNQMSPEQMQLDEPNRTPKKSENKQPTNLGFEEARFLKEIFWQSFANPPTQQNFRALTGSNYEI